MKLIVTFLLGLMAANGVTSAQTVFPGADWDYASPQSVGVDSAKFAEAITWLESAMAADRDGIEQMMVVKDGAVIYEGNDIDTVHTIYSCTKTFVSVVLGLAVDNGLCSIDTKVATVLPELDSLYPDVTFRHLLSQTSGYSGEKTTPYLFTEPRFAPGTQFEYGASWFSVVTRALTIVTNENLEDYVNRKIGSVIGMDSTGWTWTTFGMVDSGYPEVCGVSAPDIGVRICPDQFARLGHLLLNEGVWDGDTLLSPAYVREMSTAQVDASVPPYDSTAWYTGLPGMYGLGCWTNSDQASDGDPAWRNAPAGMWAFQGNKTNYCIIIPEWDMVIVREGEHRIKDPWNVFLMMVGEALETTGLHAAVAADGAAALGAPGTWFTLQGVPLSQTPVQPGMYLQYDGSSLVKAVVVE